VILVLGPGQARAFAEAGVIRALADAKIRIAGIYGVELGSLIGSLYAVDGNVNHLEWELLHFHEGAFGVQESVLNQFLNRRPSADALETRLQKAFRNRDLSKTKIPMKIVVQPAGEQARLYEKGPLRVIVRAAMAAPVGSEEGFEPILLDGKNSGSAANTRPFPIEDAKRTAASSGSVVIAVDCLDPKDSDRFPELKDADLVLKPNLRQIGLKDYSNRTDATFAGKSATLEKMDEIKKLVNAS
jgi:NTE family protein